MNKNSFTAATAAFIVAATCVAQTPAPAAIRFDEKKVLTIGIAKQIAGAALRAAVANKYSVTVTISDDGGHLLYLERMDGANISSVDSSSNKATAAVIYKQPTKNFADRLARGETLVLKLPNAMPVEGGFPLIVDGKVIGGIGVGGAPQGQFDAQIAQAGVDWLLQHTK